MLSQMFSNFMVIYLCHLFVCLFVFSIFHGRTNLIHIFLLETLQISFRKFSFCNLKSLFQELNSIVITLYLNCNKVTTLSKRLVYFFSGFSFHVLPGRDSPILKDILQIFRLKFATIAFKYVLLCLLSVNHFMLYV